jgi:hypothetical protein
LLASALLVGLEADAAELIAAGEHLTEFLGALLS